MVAKKDSTILKQAPDETQAVWLLNEPIELFNIPKMAAHSTALERAGKLLNAAYATSGAIGAIASIVRRSHIAFENGDPSLVPRDADHPLSAIDLLASGLTETLFKASDRFDEMLEKGGAQ